MGNNVDVEKNKKKKDELLMELIRIIKDFIFKNKFILLQCIENLENINVNSDCTHEFEQIETILKKLKSCIIEPEKQLKKTNTNNNSNNLVNETQNPYPTNQKIK